MPEPQKIADQVYVVAGPSLTDSRDCLCYAICHADRRILIDCGVGPSISVILDLFRSACGKPPTDLILTHAHIDHIGGASEARKRTGCKIMIHADDAPPLIKGDDIVTAADWYDMSLTPFKPDAILEDGYKIDFSDGSFLEIIHIPGHTPGSVALVLRRDNLTILFGQDIHGPFSPNFKSDINQWAKSMNRLIGVNADILAEGHYGIFQPADSVKQFIESQLHDRGFR